MCRWDITGYIEMNNEIKKIAKQLGIAVPACLLSIGVANAENTTENTLHNYANSAVYENTINNLANNDVVEFLTVDIVNLKEKMSPDHTDTHTDAGGNHANRHSNSAHADKHSNTAATTSYNSVKKDDGTYERVPYCKPHSDSHTNRDGYNSHTNSGNREHSDYHTNRNYGYDCQ